MMKNHQRGALKRDNKAVTAMTPEKERAEVENGNRTEVEEDEEVQKEGILATPNLSTNIFYDLSISTSCLGFPLLTNYF